MSLEKHSGYGIYLHFIYLSKYEIIILEPYLMIKSELLVRYNQSSTLVKSSTLSLIFVRMYWLDDKSLSLIYHCY